ncbi:MAG: DEAD/DEAH box helicase family protein [Syntrophales bacterium]|nr:DEAD/DEAH box helicase family protein [Syntrophales bacterium]
MSERLGKAQKSLFSEDVIEVAVPPCFSSEIKVDRNRARQMLLAPGHARVEISVLPPHLVSMDGSVIQLLAGATSLSPGKRALRVGREGLKNLKAAFMKPNRISWVGDLSPTTPAEARQSWAYSFSFVLEENDRPGLRLPQLGAVHGVLGYWTTGSTQPASVVMPTGTGKTETMIALLVTARPQRLLVVVPSEVLRTQLAAKFVSFGVLQESDVISAKAIRPVVGQLRHAFSSSNAGSEFAERCNVIVTTPQALFASSPNVMQALLGTCSHLFVDEAHHVEAATWRRIRDEFEDKPVLQFTATPFREDGRRIAGRIVYSFPLRQAQRHGYFSQINYISVVDFENPDKAIATRAIERLRGDLKAGLDHLLMARVKRIGRANEIQKLYMELAPDLEPVVLHSSLPVNIRQSALDSLRTRKSRIIVCVDMLGEGFDLPSLKVAAIHDLHKSLGVTLQFVGRFARVAGAEIGEASVVTGRPEGRYDESLHKLYAEEPDWNLIIRDLSEAAVGEEYEVSEFEAAFGALPEEVSLRNIEPKMSTVVYRTHCETWRPHGIYEIYKEETLLTDPIAINQQDHVAWFVTESRSPVRWGELETLVEVGYDLYVLYWDEVRHLLYVNSSNTDLLHEGLAKAVCGDDVERFSGEAVYRVMANVKRLVPTNVGVLDIRNRSRRFSMHVGADVIEGFPIAEAQTKTKTNIFAYGYENGVRMSIGASLKGRIWSYRVAPTIKHWKDWCDHIGSKVNDPGINVDEVMRGFIRPEVVETRPPYVALGLEWPWEVFLNISEETQVEHRGDSWTFIDADLKITEFSNSGPIRFDVTTPRWKAGYEILFADGGMKYRAKVADIEVVTRRSRVPFSEYLAQHGLCILFEQDATVVPPGMLLKPNRALPPFDLDKLIVFDWSGVDLRKESWGQNRDENTVQARAVEYLKGIADWEIMIDDDGPGEIADIVAARIDEDRLVVKLIHCKYSSEQVPGGRVADLYEVCGQTQKSVRWRRNSEILFHKLIDREKNRIRLYGRSGFIVGNGNTLYRLAERARMLKPDFRMIIAQPGISKEAVSEQQLDLLGSTEVYLREVANVPLHVICSE